MRISRIFTAFVGLLLEQKRGGLSCVEFLWADGREEAEGSDAVKLGGTIPKSPIWAKAMKKRSFNTYSENHFLGTEETIFNFVYSKAGTAIKYPSGGGMNTRIVKTHYLLKITNRIVYAQVENSRNWTLCTRKSSDK